MADEPPMPENHVLAIASHVTSGYVGNTMATFCMQTLGCEVSAIHTVNYSSHVGYRRFKGRKTTPEEVSEIYAGLQDARLDHFSMMLSGYCPSAALVEQVGRIARDLKLRANTQPGTFFWVLDPVMGDNGRMYVAEDTVPMYKSLLPHADLILPNQYEAELLSDVQIVDLQSMYHAVTALHQTYRMPHVLITSIRLPPSASPTPSQDADSTSLALSSTDGRLSIVGSTATADSRPRLFRITVPAFAVFFSGTGDMFAALLVARLREAARDSGLLNTASWRSPDDTAAADLPLAAAAAKVLASMHAVLKDTTAHYDSVVSQQERELNEGVGAKAEAQKDAERHLRLTRAAEVRVVQNVSALREPPDLDRFMPQAVVVDT